LRYEWIWEWQLVSPTRLDEDKLKMNLTDQIIRELEKGEAKFEKTSHVDIKMVYEAPLHFYTGKSITYFEKSPEKIPRVPGVPGVAAISAWIQKVVIPTILRNLKYILALVGVYWVTTTVKEAPVEVAAPMAWGFLILMILLLLRRDRRGG